MNPQDQQLIDLAKSHTTDPNAKSKNLKLMIQLIEKEKANINAVDIFENKSVLNWAVVRQHVRITQELIKRKADLDIPDKFGYTPAQNAIRISNKAVLGVFKQANLLKNQELLAHTPQPPEQQLLQAATSGNLPLITQLLKSKINLDTRDDLSDSTPLILAIEHKHHAIIQYLITAGASLIAKNKKGNNALHLATQLGDEILIERLIQALASNQLQEPSESETDKTIKIKTYINAQNNQGLTAFMIAAMKDDCDCLAVLFKAGAKTGIQNKDGLNAHQLAKKHHARSAYKVIPELSIQKHSLLPEPILPSFTSKNKKRAFSEAGIDGFLNFGPDLDPNSDQPSDLNSDLNRDSTKRHCASHSLGFLK